MRKAVKLVVLVSLSFILAGCDTLHFYGQAVWGQLQILQARTPLTQLREANHLAPEVVDRLILAEAILTHAEIAMDLASEGRYSSYVHLDREFVVWNVFAAPPFDLTGHQWCYPIVGCAPYRGYFGESAARRAAQKYASRGFETYVGGVPAYSTLGWFDDPLLSTFILWPEADLANLLIHELAHGRIWVNSDAAFNESFAEFVGNQGAASWLASQGRSEAWQAWLQRREGWLGFRRFAVLAKQHLESVYAMPNPAPAKQAVIAELQRCYQTHRSHLGGGRFDELMAGSFNNAFLLSVATYADWLPAFAALYADANEQWPAFYAAVEVLADASSEERQRRMDLLVEKQASRNARQPEFDSLACEIFSADAWHL